MNIKRIILSFLLAVAVLTPFAFKGMPHQSDKKVIVLGFDGLDPKLLTEMMDAGRLPNFNRLRRNGTFLFLQTSNPPQSPVAWSSFITGSNPGKHNVFDFLTRDPKTYYPKLTITGIEKPDVFEIGRYSIPLGKPVVKSYRRGKPFWQIAKTHGVSTTALLIPVTFPPDRFADRMLSGMGVPDITGTNGTFSFYTTDASAGSKATGGRIVGVRVKNNRIKSSLRGPKNDFLKDSPYTELPFEVSLKSDGQADIRIQDERFSLKPGQWSKWKHVYFDLSPLSRVKAICKFYLKSIRPEFELYISPVNIDPENPVMPVSNPESFGRELTERIGPFYTQGMPEDTWALNEGRISDRAFLQQVGSIQDERLKIFFSSLESFKRGILSAIFVSSDRIQHMFWRLNDRGHPLYNKKNYDSLGDVIGDVYRHMDTILGRTLKYVDKETILIVLSDHGFESFRRTVHINTWLIKNGFMKLSDPDRKESGAFFENIDWSGTSAYAIGLNSIYLNLKGRESSGIVDINDVKRIKRDISAGLKSLIDAKTGMNAVRRVFDGDKIYSGRYKQNGPDLIVGYNRGYRASWQTALGAAPEDKVFEDNLKKWSGDHLIDPELVPGIFLINRKIPQQDLSIMDIAPSILSIFGIKAGGMDGKALRFD